MIEVADWGRERARVRSWVRAHASELADTVCELVRLPSVGEPFDAAAARPFGDACAAAADSSRAVVERLGLEWRNHEYYAVSARLATGRADAPRIAFYSHMDVVPPGEGWSFPPFEPRVRDGWIFGRGSADNKGPLTAVLFALRYLRETGHRLDHDVVAYLGFDEERGMEDVRYLMRTEGPAQVNLVSDTSFPVCYAEKGKVSGVLSIQLGDSAIECLQAGSAANAVPAFARAVVRLREGDVEERVFRGVAAHAAFAEGADNAFVKLACNLAAEDALAARTREAFAFAAQAFGDYRGAGLGIDAHDDISGDTSCVASLASYSAAEGRLRVTFDVRHPVSVANDQVIRTLCSRAHEAGFAVEHLQAAPPFSVDVESPLVRALTRVADDELRAGLAPYAMGGITHARWIPGAVGFGAGRRDVPLPFADGRGAAHGADEAVCLEHLLQAVVVYVHAVLLLDAHPELARTTR